MTKTSDKLRVDFSLRREVLYVIMGAIAGSVLMLLSNSLYGIILYNDHYIARIIFGHIIGAYSQYTILADIIIHFATALSIVTVLGLYKIGIAIIRKSING